MIGAVRLNGYKVTTHHRDVMAINGKNKGGSDRGVDQSQQILLALYEPSAMIVPIDRGICAWVHTRVTVTLYLYPFRAPPAKLPTLC